MMSVIYLLVIFVFVSSSYGRVALPLEKLPDISENLITSDEIKVQPETDLNQSDVITTEKHLLVNTEEIVVKAPVDLITSTEKFNVTATNSTIEDHSEKPKNKTEAENEITDNDISVNVIDTDEIKGKPRNDLNENDTLTTTEKSSIVYIEEILVKTPLDVITSTERSEVITTNSSIGDQSKRAGNKTEVDNEITNNSIEDHIVVDNGTALILTPYIEKGSLAEGRKASEVNSSLFLGLQSYSGFLTVNKTYNSNLFFWYFPVLNNDVIETPWMIWLQGGPGASSMAGLFDEIGPFIISENGQVKMNPYTWLSNHSLVFIDNPVGTGFSFTDYEEGFASDMETYSEHLYTAVDQLVTLFPELKKAPLFIGGESYAGKYVPSLALELHQHKVKKEIDINLQGLLVGNAYIDPPMLSKLTQPFYYFSLLSPDEVRVTQPLLDLFNMNVKFSSGHAARSNWNTVIVLTLYMANQSHAYNYLKDDVPIGKTFQSFLRTTEIKKALHVGDIKFSLVNFTVHGKLAEEFLTSAKPKYEILLEHYRVMAYCGHLDQLLPCVSTSENYRTWKWSGFQKFINATRNPYYFGNTVSGYYKTGGNFSEAVILGAGHMVPADKPAQAQDLITRWTHNWPIPSQNYISPIPKEHIKIIHDNEIADSAESEETDDNGKHLILTPYIEDGRIDVGRQASEVDPTLFMGVKSYSGFVTVNKTFNSNTFFWYFPVEKKALNETPWIIWLQGGPGVTSMVGLFDEIGPFTVDRNSILQRNPSTWHSNFSLLYIDNPIGTGFSFTEHEDGYVKDMETYSKHLFSAVEQLLKLFPELKTAPLYVAGESYGGKYVPSLGLELHRHKNDPGFEINLQGFIVGNALIDSMIFTNFTQPFYNFALLGPEEMEEVLPYQDALNKALREHSDKTEVEKSKWTDLLVAIMSRTHLRHSYNFLTPEIKIGSFLHYLKRPEVMKAIHVDPRAYGFSILLNSRVTEVISPDFFVSSKYKFEELLEHYKVLAFCGQLDQMVPCALSSENYRTWTWSQAAQYKEARRVACRLNNKLAGYYKSGGRFTEAVIRGAGHMAASDKPDVVRTMVTRWIQDQSLTDVVALSKIDGQEVVDFVVKHQTNTSFTFFQEINYL